ncbi:MAG: F0F1 ATP synthase subunit B' [Arcobacter butzleri]|jgi:F-type H+-transporting ATPase subunit b|nr:F0F1 ATP synthase subunit B' [Arcobacteraceae bacterium]MDY0364771.1 F0F1 ATP synthase subunit B' [Arcobacteraceae bacterium]NLO17715.1 F0F1 ATP synthase subunit B' [Aliarcobacter butzleri]
MLEIDLLLLTITAVIFLLTLARLNSCLFKPLLKHMDDRAASIKNDLESAKSNSANIDGMIAEANAVLAKAKTEASAIREKAYQEATQNANSKLALAKSQLEENYANFSKLLETEKENLKTTLLAQVPLYKDAVKAKVSSL